MTEAKRLAAAQSQLPEAMIQHIQSFLNAKEAARTTLLSKSWYNAWLTRPNLDFDQDDFKQGYADKDTESRFWKFVNKVMQRYDELHLKIDSLRLWVHSSCSKDAAHYSYAKELIVKALKMGATALDFKYDGCIYDFALPNEVFGSENLITLSLSHCQICITQDVEISCSRLKSLTLDRVTLKSDDVVCKIGSSCPLIESLSLSRYPEFEYGTPDVGSVVDKFRNLKCFSLALDRYYCDFVVEIYSSSLECINLCECEGERKVLRGRFDVPNIRKFTFSGYNIPKFSFEETASNWESHISIERWTTPGATWFRDLNKLLKTLSPSKVSLSLEFLSEKKIDCAAKILGLTKPEVENLAINGPCSVNPAFFYCLFLCCRPIYITQRWLPKANSWLPKSNSAENSITNDFLESVYKRMMHQVSLNSCLVYQRTSTSSNLEEVIVEFYDESVSAWQPRLLDTLTSLGADEQRIRLHVRWGH